MGISAALLVDSGVGCVVDVTPLTPLGVLGEGGPGDSAAGADALPIPPGDWQNATANLAGMDSECGNLANVFAKPDEDQLIAGVALHGLWSSTDGGGSWQPLGTTDGSVAITNHPNALVFDPDNPKRYWESGSYGMGGVFETTDDGNTFIGLGTVRHNEVLSVDLSDPDRRTLLVGGHEQAQTLYLSTDSGATWNNIGGALPAGAYCTMPLILDAQTYLVGCGGNGGPPAGVYRTADGGTTWTQVTQSGGSAAPLKAFDGSIYWASPGSNGLMRSVDEGQTWSQMGQPGVIGSTHPIELPNHKLATLGPNYVMLSSDLGSTWRPASALLPQPDGSHIDYSGVAYSAQRKAFYIWYLTCGSGSVPVPDDAIKRFDFDYTMN